MNSHGHFALAAGAGAGARRGSKRESEIELAQLVDHLSSYRPLLSPRGAMPFAVWGGGVVITHGALIEFVFETGL